MRVATCVVGEGIENGEGAGRALPAVRLRSPGVEQVARTVTRLGSTPVVIAAGVSGAALAARRCRPVALVVLVAVGARPPVECLLKKIVGRPRPSVEHLVPGPGFA